MSISDAVSVPTKAEGQNRVAAVLLIGGISIVLARAAVLISTSRTVLRRWVIDLAVVELLLDIATFATALRLLATNASRHRVLPSRLAAAAIILHALRVLVFVLGRLRPFKDFDVRPEQRAEHDSRWSWAQVVFAAVMSVLGVVGLLTIRSRRRTR
jgi:hypothetical protein